MSSIENKPIMTNKNIKHLNGGGIEIPKFPAQNSSDKHQRPSENDMGQNLIGLSNH